MNRRRLASLLSIVAASFATLATSYAQTPPPTVEARLEGSFELDEDQPVGVQLFRLNADGFGVEPGRTTVVFRPTALLSSGDLAADVRLRVVPATGEPAQVSEAFRLISEVDDQPRSMELDCAGTACEGRFALIAEWVDPEHAGTSTVDWRVNASVELWAGPEAGEPRTSITALDSGGPPHVNAIVASPDPVRFSARSPLSYWKLVMRLGPDAALAERPVWPVVATARLAPTTTAVEAPADARVFDPLLSIEEPSGRWLAGTNYDGDSIEFDPFWACEPGAECVAEHVVGLRWADGREAVAVDASWTLDIRVIGADGSDLPVGVEVEPVPPMPIAAGSASGTFMSDPAAPATYRYSVEVPHDGAGVDTWEGRRLPAYAILRATLRSTGAAPLPPEFSAELDAGSGGSLELRVDEAASVVFDPSRYSSGCVGGQPCELEGVIHVDGTNQELAPGMAYEIDWELEIGAGVNDAALGTLEIVEILPTPAPNP